MRRIFVPLQGPSDAATLLHFAAQLASPFGARIEAALVTESAPPEPDTPGGSATASEEAAATRAIFGQWSSKLAVDGAVAGTTWQEIPDGVVYASASLGRASDLIVTRSLGRIVEAERVVHADPGARSFRDALLASGRLTLLAPAGRGDASALLDHVVVAWDGSAGAAHALGQSLALVARARAVRVVIIGRNTVGERAREAIASYVALHNEHSRLVVQDNAHRQTGRALLDAMRAEATSLVVMGVCGRSHPAGAAGTLGGTLLKVIEDGRTPILTAS